MAQIHYQNAPVPNLNGATELYMKALNSYNPAESLVGAMDAIKQRAQAQNAEDVYARASQITDANQFAQGLQDGSIVQPNSSIFGVNADVYKDLMAKRGAIIKDQILQKSYDDSVLDDKVANELYKQYHRSYELGNDGHIDAANALTRKVTQEALAQNPEYASSLARLGFAKYFDKKPWEALAQADRHHKDNLALGREKLAATIESNRLKAQSNMFKASQAKQLNEAQRKLLEQQRKDEAQGLGLQLAKMYQGGDESLEQFLAWGNKNYDPIKQVFHGVDANGNPIEVPVTPAQHAYIFASKDNPLLSAFQAQSEINRGKLAGEQNAKLRKENEEQLAKDITTAQIAEDLQNKAKALNPHSNDNYNQKYGFDRSTFTPSDEAKAIADRYDKWGAGGARTTVHEASPKVILSQMDIFNKITEEGPSPKSIKEIEEAGAEGIPLEQFLKSNGQGEDLVPDAGNGIKIKYNEAKSGLYIRRNPETNKTEIIDRKKTGPLALSDPRNYDFGKLNAITMLRSINDPLFNPLPGEGYVSRFGRMVSNIQNMGLKPFLNSGKDNFSGMSPEDRQAFKYQLDQGLFVNDTNPQITTPAKMLASSLAKSPFKQQIESVTPTLTKNASSPNGSAGKFDYDYTIQNELKQAANMNSVLAQDKLVHSSAINEVVSDSVDNNLVVATKDGPKFTGGNLKKIEAKAKKVIDNFDQALSGDPQIRTMEKVQAYNSKNYENKFKDPATALMEMNGINPGDRSMDPTRINNALSNFFDKMNVNNVNPDAALYALNFALQRQDNDHWVNSGSSYSKGKTGIGEGWSIDDQAFITAYRTYSEARTRFMDQSYKYEQAKIARDYFEKGKQNYVNSRYNKDQREQAKQQVIQGVKTIQKLGTSSIKDRLILEKKLNH